MSATPLPRIEPLIESIKALYIGDFLKSVEFSRYLISIELDSFWRQQYLEVKNNRTYVATFIDHKKQDYLDVFVQVCNIYYEEYGNRLFDFLKGFLFTFYDWKKEEVRINEVLKDFELLSVSKDIVEQIKEKFSGTDSKPVENVYINRDVWNSTKLESSILKMDRSIKNGEYNLTLTYAYSCLEGLFKAYIFDNISKTNQETDLAKLSKQVKTDLVRLFKDKNIQYPEQIINLISTITNAVSNARNSFSESHFDNDSDRWLAEFVKDCVNSIGRLILKFI